VGRGTVNPKKKIKKKKRKKKNKPKTGPLIGILEEKCQKMVASFK